MAADHNAETEELKIALTTTMEENKTLSGRLSAMEELWESDRSKMLEERASVTYLATKQLIFIDKLNGEIGVCCVVQNWTVRWIVQKTSREE